MIAQQPHSGPVVLVPDGMGLLERRSNLVHLRLRLLERHARFQPGDALEVDADVVRIPNPLSFGNDVGNPEFCRTDGADWVLKIRRHDAGNFVASTLEGNRAPHDCRVPAEAAPPEPVAQHRHAVAAVDLVLGGEGPTDSRTNAEHVEEAGGHALGTQVLGLGAGFAQRKRTAGDRGDRLEYLLLGRPIDVVLRRGAAECLWIPIRVRFRSRRPPLSHRDQPVVLVKRQTAEDHGIHHRKDRGAGADAEHQHEQRHGGERP